VSIITAWAGRIFAKKHGCHWDDGLCASLYAPTIVKARVGNGSTVTLTELTGYPFNGLVELNILATNTVSFPLYLRVPQWSFNSWIQVNARPLPPIASPVPMFASNVHGAAGTWWH